MIPKIIHYCWFGKNPKPPLAEKCIRSWREKCPDYEIIEWNEDNVNIKDCPLYVRQSYKEGRWAFVTDYVRLKVVYEQGGIYLDTDVEVLKPFDSLLEEKSFFGIEGEEFVATGLGFGSEAGTKILADLMNDYEGISLYQEKGVIDVTACPARNTKIFKKYGFEPQNKLQRLDDGVLVLPTEFLCPMNYITKELNITDATFSVHWYSSSWIDKKIKKNEKKRIRKSRFKSKTRKLIISLIGEKNYKKIKELIKRK